VFEFRVWNYLGSSVCQGRGTVRGGAGDERAAEAIDEAEQIFGAVAEIGVHVVSSIQ
jgi:hypothetical protein